jgi:hypothetical protein
MSEEAEYDVVIDVLEKHKDILLKMIRSNMNADMLNIMDDIRLDQISQLEQAIAMWKAQ